MADFIGIDVQGLPELRDKLRKLPDAAIDAGVEMVNEYLVNVLKQYPSYKYVSVEESGGWKSEKQRRYVMAAIRDGRINVPYQRTQELAQGWRVEGSGRYGIVVNETPYAAYVMGDREQSQGHMLRGWPILQQVAGDRMSQIIRRFEAGVQKAIKKLGL